MAARNALLPLGLAAAAALSCSALDPPAPAPRSVEPARGYAAAPTAVVIRGDGFLARTTRSTDGHVEAVVAQRAWLAGVELEKVVRVDAYTLHARIPAGLPAGLQQLVVENAYGERGELDAAFEVVDAPPAALVATIAAGRATAGTGQEVGVEFTVANAGGVPAELTAVAPAAGPAPDATCLAPDAALPRTLEPGASATFSWSCAAPGPGDLVLGGTASGTDAVSGAPLSAAPGAPAVVAIQTPATLAATLALPPGDPRVGQPLGLTLIVTDEGGAAAEITDVVVTVTPGGAADCSAPTPSPPAGVPGGESALFTWTCTPVARGSVWFGALVSGADANTGAPLAADASAGATVR